MRDHTQSDPRTSDELLVCGWDEVFALRAPALPEAHKVWSWRAREAAGLPDDIRGLFGTTDECKPLDSGRRVLVTSSGGAAAVVERPEGRAVFSAGVTNAHSIERLPGDLLAVAASVGEGGDRVILYSLEDSTELAHDALPSAHGLVWDAERATLWALGYNELRAYCLPGAQGGRRRLECTARYRLPDANGHDLNSVPGTPMLSVTTGAACWHFDRNRREFRLHPELADATGVKSIDVHPATGQLVWVQAEGGHWWSKRLRFLRPEAVLHLPAEHLYKARWSPVVPPDQRPG